MPRGHRLVRPHWRLTFDSFLPKRLENWRTLQAMTSTQLQIREIDPANQSHVKSIAKLHLELLHFGPMARLGELFLRCFCYEILIRDGLMKAALYEVNRRPAGFIAYTDRSISFHRMAIRRHIGKVAFLVALSIVREPMVLLRLPKAVRLMFSRRAEQQFEQDPLAEILAIGVLQEYTKPAFIKKTGVRISKALVSHAASYFRQVGLKRMRVVVQQVNKPALFFYHSLGARFEPYEHHGEAMYQAWLNLDTHIF